MENGNFWHENGAILLLTCLFTSSGPGTLAFSMKTLLQPGQVVNMHSFNNVPTMCTNQHLMHFNPMKHTVKLQI